ncbi:MAG: hypothetical protein HY901_00160, partial [Deltaproteobacteria bacterium]|nr:hypothetical protein [Deltaproteobacteria bacterium]
NGTQTRTVTSTSPAGCSGNPVLSQSCNYVPPACGSCHAIPPSTGRHSLHANSFGYSCSSCHGSGYSKTTVNSTTHMDGVSNVSSSVGFNGSSCSNSCHGSKSW